MKYKKKAQSALLSPRVEARQVQAQSESATLGMLYLVDVRLVSARTNEKFKHKLLLVGCEHADIERKLRWVFDAAEYKEMSITGIDKVREKVHFLSTVITQPDSAVGPIIDRDGHQQRVYQGKVHTEPYDPKLFAVGITTTMLAKDEVHALRKVAAAVTSSTVEGNSHTGASLSEGSTITVEEIPRASGFAAPRDVSNEINKAHFVRG